MTQHDKTTYEPVRKGGAGEVSAPRGLGARHLQAFILFISLSVAYTFRAQLSVTMVAMTDVPQHIIQNCTGAGTDCIDRTLRSYYERKGEWNMHRTYSWSKPTQDMIMFAFFVGYTSMMVPMGLFAQRFGGKTPIMIALAVNGLVSLITPVAPLHGGWVAVSLCRLVQGMTQACFFPSIHTMLGKWAPLSERGRLSTYIYTGSQFGTVVIFPVAGYLSASFGWPYVFWVCGVLGFVSLGLVATFTASSPHQHRSIGQEELYFITGELTSRNATKRRVTPWRHILSSSAVWGMIVTHCGSAVGYIYLFTQIPLYMTKILGVDIKNSGVFSSLPYIGMYLTTLTFGALSDYLANNNYMSIVNIRRLGNTIGMAVSGGFLIAFSYVTSTIPAVVLLVLCLSSHSGVQVGFLINQIDLAPNFAGPMMAVGNMLGNLSALGVPLLVSNIVRDVSDRAQWQMVSLIVAVIQIVSNVVYVVFAKAEVQPWNDLEATAEDEEEGAPADIKQ